METLCTGCGEAIPVISNIFTGDSGDYKRTNVYQAQGLTEIASDKKVIGRVGAKFSKSVIRNGILYFWKQLPDSQSVLVCCNIARMIEKEDLDAEAVSAACAVTAEAVNEIEIFNKYILTSMADNILVNSIIDGSLTANININQGGAVKAYKAAVLGNNLVIVCLLADDTQEIRWGDLSKGDLKLKAMDTGKAQAVVQVDSSPVLIEGSHLYFAGYDGNVHKVYNKDNAAESSVITVNYAGVMQPGGIFYVSQLAASGSSIYLTLCSDAVSYVSASSNEGVFSIPVETAFDIQRKIALYDNVPYGFMKIRHNNFGSSFNFCRSLSAGNWGRLEPVYQDFSDASDVFDYCISQIDGKPYLIYLHKSNTKNILQIFAGAIENNEITERYLLNQMFVSLESEFLLYDNLLVVCDHHTNGRIIVSRWDNI